MAKQTGIIKLKGTLGDITFYKEKRKNLKKRKEKAENTKHDSTYLCFLFPF